MGNGFAKIWKNWIGVKEMRLIMLGLDGAGKTTILYKIKIGEVVNTIPTIGFNVENVEYKNINLNVWDLGGQSKIRLLWRHYYTNVQAIIFVVDSTDKERIEENRDELQQILSEQDLNNVSLLVFANKQDGPGAMNCAEITRKLGLHTINNRKWFIQASCAVSGNGLVEGLDWIINNTN